MTKIDEIAVNDGWIDTFFSGTPVWKHLVDAMGQLGQPDRAADPCPSLLESDGTLRHAFDYYQQPYTYALPVVATTLNGVPQQIDYRYREAAQHDNVGLTGAVSFRRTTATYDADGHCFIVVSEPNRYGDTVTITWQLNDSEYPGPTVIETSTRNIADEFERRNVAVDRHALYCQLLERLEAHTKDIIDLANVRIDAHKTTDEMAYSAERERARLQPLLEDWQIFPRLVGIREDARPETVFYLEYADGKRSNCTTVTDLDWADYGIALFTKKELPRQQYVQACADAGLGLNHLRVAMEIVLRNREGRLKEYKLVDAYKRISATTTDAVESLQRSIVLMLSPRCSRCNAVMLTGGAALLTDPAYEDNYTTVCARCMAHFDASNEYPLCDRPISRLDTALNGKPAQWTKLRPYDHEAALRVSPVVGTDDPTGDDVCGDVD